MPGSRAAGASAAISNTRAVWEYAKANEYVILCEDDDFLRLQSIFGYPPKIILLKLGNCTNQQILELG